MTVMNSDHYYRRGKVDEQIMCDLLDITHLNGA